MTRDEFINQYSDGKRDFSEANLSGVDLSEVNLSRADLVE
jgi:uncharacterized protein YjbI with pentapeptide repeats